MATHAHFKDLKPHNPKVSHEIFTFGDLPFLPRATNGIIYFYGSVVIGTNWYVLVSFGRCLYAHFMWSNF